METRILITGASGCGTTTLGKALALRAGAAFYDTDDYYWTPSDPPFRNKTPPATRLARLLEDLRKVPVAVIAGSMLNWGAELEDSLSLIVFLTVPAEIRVARLRARELQRFGSVTPEFLTWAAQYDHGYLEGRSLARHQAWLAQRRCPVLGIDGDTSTEYRVARVLGVLNCEEE